MRAWRVRVLGPHSEPMADGAAVLSTELLDARRALLVLDVVEGHPIRGLGGDGYLTLQLEAVDG